MIPPLGRCVWECGSNAPFNREHIIGQQIANLLTIPYPIRMVLGDYRGPEEHTFEVVLEQRVCRRCNGGWMRKVDNRMVNFMAGTLRHGSPVTLSLQRQRLLAFWAVKVGMLLEIFLHDEAPKHPNLEMGPASLPGDNLAAAFKHQRPPLRTEVWIGAVTQPEIPHFSSIGSGIFVADRSAPHELAVANERGYFLMFTLGPLLFFVVGWELAWQGTPPATHIPQDLTTHSLRRICPQTPPQTHWPPPRHLTKNDLARLARSYPEW